MPARLLIADDSPVSRFWLKNALKRLSPMLWEADSGSALDTQLRDQGPFDFVVVKAQLPGVNAQGLISGLHFGPYLLVHEIRGHHALVSLAGASGASPASQMVVTEKALADIVADRLVTRHSAADQLAPASSHAPSSKVSASRS